MSNYATVAIHEVNKWVWYRLQNDLPDDFSAYLVGGPMAGIRPIIPSQQVSEFNNIETGAPFIVYTYTLTGGGDSWWMHADNIVYTIYDADEARLRRIQNYLNTLLRRLDYAASEANTYLNLTPPTAFDIKYIGLTGGSGPDPYTAEGGRQGAMLTFRIEYTVDISGTVSTGIANPSGMRV